MLQVFRTYFHTKLRNDSHLSFALTFFTSRKIWQSYKCSQIDDINIYVGARYALGTCVSDLCVSIVPLYNAELTSSHIVSVLNKRLVTHKTAAFIVYSSYNRGRPTWVYQSELDSIDTFLMASFGNLESNY